MLIIPGNMYVTVCVIGRAAANEGSREWSADNLLNLEELVIVSKRIFHHLCREQVWKN